MAVFALVELELHGLPQVTIREIAQNILRFDDTAQVGKGLRQPVGRKAVGQSLQRAGRCWGLCRYRDLLDLKVHVRIPAFEDGAQFPVERPHARL